MRLKDCHNFQDFRKLAKKATSPIFTISTELQMMKLPMEETQALSMM